MNKRLNKHGIVRFWFFQLGLMLAVTVFCAAKYDAKAADSALMGGLIGIIPSALFASRLFKYEGARAAKQIVSNFYKGETLKIILSIFLFALVFRFCKITPLAFFASYVLVLMTHWFAPWIIVNKQNRPKSD